MKRPDNSLTTSLKETVALIFNTLIPNDVNNRTFPVNENTSYEYRQCTEAELKDVLWKMKSAKAPGIDNFTSRIIKKSMAAY